MEYQVSARKHRPMTFEEVSGQPHIVRTLTNALTSGRTAHAYLFSGMRGVGKTTMARILAKALNCERGPTAKPCLTCPSCLEIGRGAAFDVMEIDGASSNSVDDVREMRETIRTAPARDRYRIYIIDEVHMLSTAAFNALLKTLEEPPAHVVFIFATTECHKIPQTILSRCQHFTFRRISRREIADQLKRIAQGQDIAVDERSVTLLARAADGSMRDALSLLDQAVAFGGKQVRVEDLMALLGSVSRESLRELVTAILEQDPARALRAIAAVQDCGSDLRQFCSELMEHIRNILVAKMVPDADDLIELAPEELAETKADASRLSVEHVQEIFRIFHQAEEGLRNSQHPWFLLEMAAVRASRLMTETTGASSGKTTAGPAQAGAASQARPAPNNKNTSAIAPGMAPARPESAKTDSLPMAPDALVRVPDSRPEPAKTDSSGTTPAHPGSTRPLAQEGKGYPGQTPSPLGQRPESAKADSLPLAPSHDALKCPPAIAPSQSPDAPGRVPGPRPESAKAEEPPNEKPLSGNGGWELNWEAVVDRVHRDRPNIGAFLQETALVGIEHDTVTIGYPASSGVSMKMILKEDYQRMILEACQAVAGRPVRLRVVTLPAAASTATVAHRRRQREEVTEQRLRQEALANPLVQEALSVFSGEIKEVRSKHVTSTESVVAGKTAGVMPS